MLTIKHPIKFPSFEQFSLRAGVCQEHKALIISIVSDDSITIWARIRWGYTTEVFSEKEFPFSEDGYSDACSWTEKQRIKMAEDLL